jgi:YARHG domain/TIR domain
MTMIMVSYRRADAQDMAGRISDYLIGKYGETSVFFDVNSIRTGVNYRKRIENAILGSDVVVIVIGLHWLGKTPKGKPRLNDPGDPVRVEIETAMKHKKPILPLLVNGATMPEESELPDTLRELPSYNAAKVDSGQDFRIHMRRLIDSIDETLGTSEGQSPLPAPAQPGRFSLYGAGALAAAAALAGLLWSGVVSFEWPTMKASTLTETGPQGIPASITARARTQGGFIFADSDQRLLGEDELKGLSLTELRVARNEIYARRGRFFVDQKLSGYFSQFSWYHPRQVDVELSPLETTNVNTIQAAERQK